MKTRIFKTNIHCTGCLSKISPILDKAVGKDNWEVDIQSPEKTLTVSNEHADNEAVQTALDQAGYKAEPVS